MPFALLAKMKYLPTDLRKVLDGSDVADPQLPVEVFLCKRFEVN
jgi:hypothetical protein